MLSSLSVLILPGRKDRSGSAINKKDMFEGSSVSRMRCYPNRVRDGAFRLIPKGSTIFSTWTVFRSYRDYFFEIDTGNERSMADNTQCWLC